MCADVALATWREHGAKLLSDNHVGDTPRERGGMPLLEGRCSCQNEEEIFLFILHIFYIYSIEPHGPSHAL